MVTETIKRKDGCKAKGRISGVPSLVLGALRTVGTLPHAGGVLHPARIAARASRGAHLPLGEARAPGRQPCGLGKIFYRGGRGGGGGGKRRDGTHPLPGAR